MAGCAFDSNPPLPAMLQADRRRSQCLVGDDQSILRRWGLMRALSYIVRPAPAPIWPKMIVLRASSIRARPDLSYPTRLPSTTEPVARWA